MPGPTPPLADIAPLSAHDLLTFAAPVLVLAVLGWVISRTDHIVHAVLPDLEWERNLGWLNIRAEKRANRAMRWVGIGVVILLLDSLAGMLWAAKGIGRVTDWADPWAMGELALRVPAGAFCLLIWVIYLGLGLLPRLRAEREAASYKKFRAEIKAADDEKRALHEMARGPSRTQASLPKPRTDAKAVRFTAKRHWRQHPPGG